MSLNLPNFNVDNMDLSGIDSAELQNDKQQSDVVRYLKKPGTYNLSIVSAELYTPEKKKDKAGKQWGSIRLVAKTEGGLLISDFIDVPIEAVLYTGNGGKTSSIKTKIFSSLIQSVTGEALTIADVPNAVKNLSGILVEGAQFRASVNYRGDRVRGHREQGANSSTFTIEMVDGSEMLDSDGNVAKFAEFRDAVDYYKSIKKFAPATGLSYTGFYKAEAN